MEKLIIGSHVSFTKDTQIIGSIEEALSYGSNTFMFYTGAPQNTNRAPINKELVEKGKILLQENNIDINNIVVHAPYIINLANPKNIDFGIRFLKEEIERCEQIGINLMVLHPGSHVGVGVEEGINNIAFCLNHALTNETKVKICLETMAGKGSEVGISFEQIKSIIDKIELKDKIGVCLDTCHINDAGYDLNNFEEILDQFDNIIGLNKLYCVHINDSKNERGSHKDRHENIGYGNIGFDNLISVIYNERLDGIPKILETPYISLDSDKKKSYPPYKFEIEMIKNKKFNNNLKEEVINYYK
jgi:deoxyribonuclease-4